MSSMQNKKPAPAAPEDSRRFAVKKKAKKNDFEKLVDAAGFLLTMGLLICAAGLIFYIAFHTRISMYILDIGLVLSLFAFAVKLLDVSIKILGGRS